LTSPPDPDHHAIPDPRHANLHHLRDTTEGRTASRELLEDERRFVDLHASCIWVGEEVEMIAGADSRI
jgi:hypothetical protein